MVSNAALYQRELPFVLSRDEKLTFVASLHGRDNTAPSVHNTLAQGDDVVEHLVRAIGRGSNARRLLEDLGDNGQVGLEVALDGDSNITETLENRRLELVRKAGALLMGKKRLANEGRETIGER